MVDLYAFVRYHSRDFNPKRRKGPMFTDPEVKAAEPVKKAPRKPRPSEVAAKKAKAAAKRKPKAKAKKAAKKKPARKSKAKRPKVVKTKRDRRRKLKVKPASKTQRTERLDMRVTKDAKRALEAKAKKLDRTVTAVAWLAIQKGLKGLR